MREAVVGLDLGTSGLKVVVVDADHHVLARSTVAYDLVSGQPGHAEIDPATWGSALTDGVRAVLADVDDVRVVGVGIDGQMHGLVAVDDAGEPVRPAMLWPDTRAQRVASEWSGLPRERLRALANPLAPGMAGPMLAWLIDHEPATMGEAAHVVQPKDWLRGQLTGWAPITDPSDASATLLWDVDAASWDRDLCELVGLDASLLAEVRPSHEVAGHVTATAAAATGLPRGVPVAVGCADVAATLLGLPVSGARRTVTLGTGAQALGPGGDTARPYPPRHHTYATATGTTYTMAAVMNAGLALARVVEWTGASWAELYAALEREPDQDRAVPTFLPYLTGERPPLAVTAGQAGFHGLELGTTRPDLLAAALEGVVFAVARALDELPEAEEDAIDLGGGGARDAGMHQLLADVLGVPVRRVDRPDATAVGASVLGWAAADAATPSVPTMPNGAVVAPRPRPRLHERRRRFTQLTDELVGRTATP